MPRHRGETRILNKLHNAIANGEWYEAHQIYRSIYFRFMTQARYDELQDMIHEGTTVMLANNQYSSAVDLAMLLINVLKLAKVKPCEVWKNRLCGIFSLLPSTVLERSIYLIKFMDWLAGTPLQTDPALHREIAHVFWREKNFPEAHKHFLHAKDGVAFAQNLIEFQTSQGFRSELDMFIAQAVLQLLCLKDKKTAAVTFSEYTKKHPEVRREHPPFDRPLLNFIAFILMVIESGHAGAFEVLCAQYRVSIQRDPCYRQYLEKIGLIYFAIQPATVQGTFEDFLRSLFGDLDINDDDVDTEPIAHYDCGDMD